MIKYKICNIKKFIERHKFFVTQSRVYIGKYSFKDKLYYPIAYIKFMYYSYKY